jgi:hypothetical protein
VTPHRKPSPVASGDGSTLPRPQRRILAALSFWQSIGDKSPTREQVAAVAGYSPGSSHYSNMLGAMHTADLIGYPHPGRVAVTPAGARHVNGAMTPSAARSALFKILTGPQRALVTAAQDHAMLTREELATRAGYSPASSHYSNTVGQLCTLTVFDKPQAGHVGLTDWARKLVESAA